jgi:hypothetical protein
MGRAGRAGRGVALVEGVGEGFETVVVEVPVQVEGHRRCGMCGLPLNGLDAGSARDHERSRRMPKVLHSEPRVDPGSRDSSNPDVAPDVRQRL